MTAVDNIINEEICFFRGIDNKKGATGGVIGFSATFIRTISLSSLDSNFSVLAFEFGFSATN